MLFFGGALSARVATVGLNPSKRECVDRRGAMLSGVAQRFAGTSDFGVTPRDELSDAQAVQARERMQTVRRG